MRVHLPLSQRDFFLQEGGDRVEVRAQWYENKEDLAKTTADTVFYTRPSYQEGKN